MSDGTYRFDVAVTFAGEQRDYVEKFVRECEARGLRVAYDHDQAVDIWGRNFIIEFRKIYGGELARVVVAFISKEYLAKPIPLDELAAAITQGFARSDAYVLPVRVGDVTVPPELLNPAIHFLRTDDHSPAELAEKTAVKLGLVTAPPAVAPLRAPRIAPTAFAPRAELESAVHEVAVRFRRSADIALEPYGYTCHITRDRSGVDIQVEQAGRPVCGMSLWSDIDNPLARDALAMSFAWPTNDRRRLNGRITAGWDPVAGGAVLVFSDFGRGVADQRLTVDRFVETLWEKIIDFIERSSRSR